MVRTTCIHTSKCTPKQTLHEWYTRNSPYKCVYVCTFQCVCIYMCVCCSYMYIYNCTSSKNNLCISVYVCMCVKYIYIHIHTCVCIYIYIYAMHMYIYMHTYIYMHIYVYMYIYACIDAPYPTSRYLHEELNRTHVILALFGIGALHNCLAKESSLSEIIAISPCLLLSSPSTTMGSPPLWWAPVSSEFRASRSRSSSPEGGGKQTAKKFPQGEMHVPLRMCLRVYVYYVGWNMWRMVCVCVCLCLSFVWNVDWFVQLVFTRWDVSEWVGACVTTG
jgi:hypothetical protein